MKNKRLFAILSTLFCVGAICGLFSLFILPKKEVNKTSAVDLVVQTYDLAPRSFVYASDSITYDESLEEDVRIINTYVEDGVEVIGAGANLTFTRFEVTLYQNNDTSSNRYRIGILLNANLLEYNLSDIYRLLLVDDFGNSDIYLYSDFLTDISIFNFNIIFTQLSIDIEHINDRYVPHYSLAFQIQDMNNDQIETIFTYGTFKYNANSRPLYYSALFAAQLFQHEVTYLSPPWYVQPYRPGIFIGNVNFNALENDYTIGYNVGFNEGYNNGYSVGNVEGYNNGYNLGYLQGVDSQQNAINNAYNDGYAAGLNAGENMDSTTFAIFNGILQIGMLPVNIFLQLFDFTVLGISLKNFVLSLISTLIVIKVVHFVIGSGIGGGTTKK